MAFSLITTRGSFIRNASGNANPISLNGTISVGEVCIVGFISDNGNNIASTNTNFHNVTDSKFNIWNKVFERTHSLGVANDGITISLWWSKITTELNSTIPDIINCTTLNNVTDVICSAVKVTIGLGKILDFVSGFTNYSANGISSNFDHTLSSLPSREYLLIGLLGGEGASNTKTADSDYVERYDLRTSSTISENNIHLHFQSRIATLTSDTISTTGVVGWETIQSLTAFYEIDEGVVYDVSVNLQTVNNILQSGTFDITFDETFTFVSQFDFLNLDHQASITESIGSSIINLSNVDVPANCLLQSTNIISLILNGILESTANLSVQSIDVLLGNITSNFTLALQQSLSDSYLIDVGISSSLNLLTINETGESDPIQDGNSGLDLSLMVTDQLSLEKLSELIISFITSAIIEIELQGDVNRVGLSNLNLDAVDTYSILIDFIKDANLNIDLNDVYFGLMDLIQVLNLDLIAENTYSLVSELFKVLNLEVYTQLGFDSELTEGTRPIEARIDLISYVKLRFFAIDPNLLKIIGATLIKYIKIIK